jgi:CheY-like chemotaxis protein
MLAVERMGMTVTHGVPADAPEQSEIRVLVVDDEPEFTTLVRQYLEAKSDAARVVTTTDPENAVRLVEQESFDCVISDYAMPEMNGVELLDELDRQAPELPCLIFTNVDEVAVARRTREHGARFLTKQGDPYEELLEWVETTTTR